MPFENCKNCGEFVIKGGTVHKCEEFEVNITEHEHVTCIWASDEKKAAERVCRIFDKKSTEFLIAKYGSTDKVIVKNIRTGQKKMFSVTVITEPQYEAEAM